MHHLFLTTEVEMNQSAPTILVVEDEAIIGMEIQVRLSRHGYKVPFVVATGLKAIEKTGAVLPDLVLMDISLKGDMDGIEAAEKIREQYAVPVVFLTANTDEKTFQRAKRSVPFGYIQKPFQENALLTTIEIALYKGQAEKELYRYRNHLEEMVKEKTNSLILINQELVIAKEAAESASKLKNQFLANMSHEIRTPLNIILGNILLALETPSSSEQIKFLKNAYNASDSLQHMLNYILDISKIEAGQLDIDDRFFNLRELMQKIINCFTHSANEKDIGLSWSVSALVPDSFCGDEYRIRQILSNLLENAVKFTYDGSIIVYTELVSLDEPVAVLKFSVKDTGIGIKEEFKKEIFKEFSQEDNSVTRRFGGVGLGLAVCEKMVRLLGGKIWFESEAGKGSTFYFQLSFKVECTQKTTAQITEQDVTDIPLDVLLVEDNLANRHLIKIVFERKGHRVITASDGIECLNKMTGHNFSFILMDIQMPNMDGIEAAAYIRQCEQGKLFPNHKHESLLNQLRNRIQETYTPIIALTAHAMSGDREKCLEAGMDDYLTKPFQPKRDFQIIKQVVLKTRSIS